MKYMNCMGCQVLLLVGLAIAGGAIANLARSGNAEKFLPWSTDLYAAPKPAPTPTPATEKPADGTSQPKPAPDTPDGGAPTPDVTDSHATPTEDHGSEEGEFPRIGFEAALVEYEAGATFVDARRTKDYVEGHITGAISISPYEQSGLAEKISRVAQEVPEEAPVVVYCTASADCEDSAMISRQLQAAGLQNITIYKGGFPEWDAKLQGDERRSKLITKGAEPGEREP